MNTQIQSIQPGNNFIYESLQMVWGKRDSRETIEQRSNFEGSRHNIGEREHRKPLEGIGEQADLFS